MKKIRLVIYTLVVLISLVTSSYAQIEEVIFTSSYLSKLNQADNLNSSPESFLNVINSKDYTSIKYAQYPEGKLNAGLINTTTCWSDIPRRIAIVSEKYSVVGGFTLGLIEGILSSSVRAVAGGVDMATSVLPSYEEKPLLEPEYKTSFTNDGFKIKILRW